MSYWCKCTTTGGDDLGCHTPGAGNQGYAPQNWYWFTVHSANCCPGGSRAGGVHPTCQGHSCAYLETTTCTGSVVPGIGVDGEEEMMTGGSQPQLTEYDGGTAGVSTNKYIPSDTPYKTEGPTIEYDKKISEDTRDGDYFTLSGEEWSGPTHRMPGGMLMSGNPHDIDGSGSEGRSEILNEIYTVYLTPSGKQWCGDMHESMLGTLMSGRARDVFGSGPDGKSELLSKNIIKNSLSSTPYKSCKTDEPKPSWDCTSIGCMLLPPWWTQGQFTGPTAYVDCMNVCKSWLCNSFVLFPPFNFEFCLCAPVQGTGATQTYPTQALCLSATTTDPCCTDDENTYNCTINGCEVHTGPGFGTYNQVPYALYECQQDCVAWGCYDLVYSSAHTTTGYSYTDDSTAHTYSITGWTADLIEYEFTSSTATTLSAESTDICIEAWYDTTSMNSQVQGWAEDAVDQWMIDEQQPGGMLEFWTGTFLNHRQVNFSTPGGWTLGEKFFRWPEYTLDAIDAANGDIPGTDNPTSPCRNVFVIAFIDEANSDYYQADSYWVNNGAWIQGDITDYMNKHDQWTSPANAGTLQLLVYPARSCGGWSNCGVNVTGSGRGIIKQLFQITQGWKLNTGPPTNPLVPESGDNVLSYANGPVWGPSSGPGAPINGNIYEITDYAGNTSPIYGNPGQFGLPGIFSPLIPQPGPTPGIGCNSFVHLGCPDWWTTMGNSCAAGAPSNPYTPMDDFQYNQYLMMEPLENYNVWAQYDRRQTCPPTPGVWNVNSIGPDLNLFMMANVMTGTSSTYGVIITNLGPQISGTSVTEITASTYTAITSNTVTVWWTGHTCLSAETIQTPDYPYLDYNVCIQNQNQKDCKWPGISCGINGCHSQSNGTWVDDVHGLGWAACEQDCRQWSCVTKTGGLQPEGGWPDVLPGALTPLTCVETIEDANGVTFYIHQPITGGTYEFVEHCFGIFQPSTIYQPNVGLLLGGLWDNTGTTWVQGTPTTTIVNGLVVNDMGGGNCKTWHPDYPHVPGRITKITSFRLVDLNGNTIYEHGGFTAALDIMNELANGVGYGWGNAFPTPLPPFAMTSPDWPNGMPPFVVGPGIPLHRLIGYGNNTTGDNSVKEFTVEVDVFGCPCEQICYCELVPGIDTANTTTWSMSTPNAWQLCTDECCEKTKTWKCPDFPIHRHLLCNNCPNGGGCYDPLDGSGPHSTQSLCEDDCAVSYDCFSATPISAVTSYSANTTCEHVDYTMVGGQYLYLLPYSGIPVSYFQGQEPTGTQNGAWTVAQNNFSGWTWGRWSDVNPANPIIKEAFKFKYGALQGINFGGVSNAFEAFIYIFDERKGYHNTEFNKIGFWTGNLWDNDTTHTCEYPSPQGDKELGVMDGFRNNEFSTMFCIDYEIRHNKRPWVATLDPLLNGVPHPYAVSHDGKYWVQGAATMCGRNAGEEVQYNNGPPDYLTIDNQERSMTHGLKDGSGAEAGGSTRSKYKRYTFKSVKDLKEKIHWMYSQPDYVDTYGWGNLGLYEAGMSLGQSQNETNLQSGACTRLGRDLARLYNPGPMMSLCTDLQGNNYTVPHPSNGLKDTTTTIHGLQLKDFWSIGMFRNRHPGAKWHFTPFNNYWEFERAGETGLSIAYNSKRVKYNSFMTLGPGSNLLANILSGYNLYPGVTSLGIYAYGQMLGPAESYGLMGRSVSIFGNIAGAGGFTYVPDNMFSNYLGPVLACQCEMPCYCDIINGDQGDYETQMQCHSNCCPDYYHYICCQPDTNQPPTSIPPFQVSCLYNINNCQCPIGSHQVACPWIVGGTPS